MKESLLATNLAQMATRALLYEVVVNPKPGLVDPVSAGPHSDMNVFTFVNSATSLTNYFYQCAVAGQNFDSQEHDMTLLFQEIRPLGQQAEKTMFTATQGVNTHKGAIFSLGVLVTATAQQLTATNKYALDQVIAIVKEMLNGLTNKDFKQIHEQSDAQLTAGERQFLKYGTTGIRGEAEAGFPTVTDLALPFLRQRPGSTMTRLMDTLIMIAGKTDDSNLIKRAGTIEITDWMTTQSEDFFALGGSGTKQGQQFLKDLNETFTRRNLSLGGSADLLILTIYLGMLEETLE